MTEHSTPTTPQDEAAKAAQTPKTTPLTAGETMAGSANTRRGKLSPSILLAVLAIILTFLLAAGLYGYGTRQIKHQNVVNQQLQSRLDALQQAQQQQLQQYQTALSQQGQELSAAQRQAASQDKQLGELRDKVASI